MISLKQELFSYLEQKVSNSEKELEALKAYMVEKIKLTSKMTSFLGMIGMDVKLVIFGKER